LSWIIKKRTPIFEQIITLIIFDAFFPNFGGMVEFITFIDFWNSCVSAIPICPTLTIFLVKSSLEALFCKQFIVTKRMLIKLESFSMCSFEINLQHLYSCMILSLELKFMIRRSSQLTHLICTLDIGIQCQRPSCITSGRKLGENWNCFYSHSHLWTLRNLYLRDMMFQ